MRTCGAVRGRLSSWVDGDLAPAWAREISAHLAVCPGCARVAEELRAVSGLVGGLPRLAAREPVAQRVLERLEIEFGGARPALAMLFRGFAAARPYMLPSLVPAGLVLVALLALVLALDPGPLPEVHLVPGAWGVVPASGTERNPLLPSIAIAVPRETERLALEALAAGPAEGSLFLETVVARDGSVAGVTVLDGSAEDALIQALRRQRFEPVRHRGRPVAVSVYRLISRVDVRAPVI